MEGIKRYLTEKELNIELQKDPRQIDFDYLLKRGGGGRNAHTIYYFIEDELRRMPGGEENWRKAVREWFATHNPDDDGQWWMTYRLNELMGSPLKLARLPDWERPEKLWHRRD